MKTIINLIFLFSTIMLVVGCSEEENFDTRGIIYLQVFSGETGQPVSNATVEVYTTEDNWAFEENRLRNTTTGSNGEVIIDKLSEGQYYFDVRSENMNNWQSIDNYFTFDGEITFATIYISENINQVISNVSGISWEVVGISNSLGQDLSNDPNFSCYLDNVDEFEKAGYYGRLTGSDKCEINEASLVEGSWWGGGTFYLYLLLDGTVHEYMIMDLTEDSFSAQPTNSVEDIILHYQRQ